MESKACYEYFSTVNGQQEQIKLYERSLTFNFTSNSSVTVRAVASVVIHSVNTFGSVQTVVTLTIVKVF